MSRHRPQNLVAVELVTYFLTADTVQGMQSSWAPLINLAMGGFGGTSDPERRITDRRFGWPGRERGDAGGTTVTEIASVRDTRNALLALPPRSKGEPSWYDVLYAAHGSIPWARIIDEGKVGTAAKVTAYITPSLLGVALLTAEVQKGLATDRKATAAKAKPGKLVVSRSHNLDKVFVNEERFDEGRTVDAYRRGATDPVAADSSLAGPGPWLLALCRIASLPSALSGTKIPKATRKAVEEKAAAATARLGIIQGQAIALLASAEAIYKERRYLWTAEDEEAPEEDAAADDAASEREERRARPQRRRGPNRARELPIGGAR